MKIFACCIFLSVIAAPNLNASSSTVPSKDSTLIVPFTNGTSQRRDHWPPLPYVYAIDPNLSIYIIRYGDLIPESQEEVALAILVTIEDQIATSGGSDDEISTTMLNVHGVFVSFQAQRTATLPLRRWEAVEAIHTIRILMIAYGARNLPSVEVLLANEVLSHFGVHFLVQLDGISSSSPVSNNSETATTDLIVRSDASLSWPPVPYTFRIKNILQMTIFEYDPDFAASKQDVLDSLSRIELSIRQKRRPDEPLPSVIISLDPVAVVFKAVRYPPLPLTHLQAAQAIHAISGLIEEYGPRRIKQAEIGVVGLRAMLFRLESTGPASGNRTSFLTLSPPSNDSAPTPPALVARSNMTLSNTNMAGDEEWPSLPSPSTSRTTWM